MQRKFGGLLHVFMVELHNIVEIINALFRGMESQRECCILLPKVDFQCFIVSAFELYSSSTCRLLLTLGTNICCINCMRLNKSKLQGPAAGSGQPQAQIQAECRVG